MHLPIAVKRRNRKPSTRVQRSGLALFWLFLISYAYIVRVDHPSFNSESHLYTAFSIVDHHSLNIDPYHTRLGDESYWHGHYYSDKAPGLSLLAVPPYAALRIAFPGKRGRGYEAFSHNRYAIPRDTAYLRYAISYMLIMLPSALFAVILWLFLCRFSPSMLWAGALTAVYSLGTIAFYYSTVFFSHQISAMLLFSAFLILFTRTKGAQWSRTSAMWAASAGCLSGYAVISEYPTVALFVLLAVYAACIRGARVERALTYIAGALPAATLGLGYNFLAFGKPFATGYMHVHSDMYRNEVAGSVGGIASPAAYGLQLPSVHALFEITFGTYRGIFLVSPVLLLFFVGIACMWRRKDVRPEFFLCLAAVALYFLLDASHSADLNGWSGGASVASRHLTPVLPFMVFPMVFGLRHRGYRWALTATGTVSIALQFAIVTAGGDFSITDPNPIINEAIVPFVHGRIFLNWGGLLGLTGLPSLVPLAVIGIGLTARFIVQVRSHDISTIPARESRTARAAGMAEVS